MVVLFHDLKVLGLKVPWGCDYIGYTAIAVSINDTKAA